MAELYPHASREADAARLGISTATLGNYCYGVRVPSERVAQVISADSNGRLTVAKLRGWSWERQPGSRFFDTDPMPPAVAQPGLVFRDRESDRGLIVYLTGLADDPMMPVEQRAFARELASFLQRSPVEGVRP